MSVQKEIANRKDGSKRTSWRVRWQEDSGRWRNKSFERKRDADDFDADLRRRRRLGTLAELDAGKESLDTYVVETWIPIHAHTLAEKTRVTYGHIYDRHVSPFLGDVPLRSLNVELIGRWYSDRMKSGAGKIAVRQALGLLSNILQRAFEAGRITSNPARLVRKGKPPASAEVTPLAPATVEAIRARLEPRDAMLVSLLAYAGLRPGEALGLRWSDIGERTILVERAVSFGKTKGTKTQKSRNVRLLKPLAQDLAEWRLRSARPAGSALVIPARDGGLWTNEAYKSWGRKTFGYALSEVRGGTVNDPGSQPCPTCGAAPGKPCRTPRRKLKASPHVARTRVKVQGRPYDLRHSFASLLLHEGRSVIYVAKQLGHGAQLTLNTYGHVIEEFEDAPNLEAEEAIRAAREATGAQPHVGRDRNQLTQVRGRSR